MQGKTAEIICVGTELLMGSTLNTNATEIAAALAGIGLNLYHSSVVGDNPARLAEAVKLAGRLHCAAQSQWHRPRLPDGSGR